MRTPILRLPFRPKLRPNHFASPDTLVDESDPDTSATQIDHLLQTAEAMRRDGKPEWMQVTGLVHDLGKLLYFFGSDGQWDVVVGFSIDLLETRTRRTDLDACSFGSGRYFRRWLPGPDGEDCLLEHVWRQPRPSRPALQHQVRHVLAQLRAREHHDLLGT